MPKDGTTLPHPFATYCVGWFLSVSGHREIAYRALLNLSVHWVVNVDDWAQCIMVLNLYHQLLI
jgi:hypothetical protein